MRPGKSGGDLKGRHGRPILAVSLKFRLKNNHNHRGH
jgi:hypothetical protein